MRQYGKTGLASMGLEATEGCIQEGQQVDVQLREGRDVRSLHATVVASWATSDAARHRLARRH